MKNFTRPETAGLLGSLAAYVLLTVWAVILYNTSELAPTWSTGVLGGGAVAALLVFFGVTVRATRRQDQEGVERENAARASMVTVLVVVAGGLSYSLLEAFAGAPRLTAAVIAAAAGLMWILAWTWLSREP
ncbi:hypothetical protein ACX80N_16425 [Arthrobacter sp. MDT2-16]